MDSQSKSFYKNTDWGFLLFLCGAVYVKLYIKIATIVLYGLYAIYKQYNFKKPISLTWFYFLIVIAGTVSSFAQHSFNVGEYFNVYILGATTWIFGGLISYLIYTAIINIDSKRIADTIKAFFTINVLISIMALVQLMLRSRHLVPYWYWEASEYFGASTGDHIKGLFNSNSVTNAMVSAFGVIYFIYRKEFRFSFICLLVCLLCTSNFTLFLLTGMLVFLHFTVKERRVKKYIRLSVISVLILYPVLSPLNVKYINTTYSAGKDNSLAVNLRQLDSAKIKEQQILTGRNEIEKSYGQFAEGKNKNNYYNVRTNDSFLVDYAGYIKYAHVNHLILTESGSNVAVRQDFLKATIEKWYAKKFEQTPLSTYYKPIKLYSFFQTIYFLKSGVGNFLLGAGVGNFSSKLAIKATGLSLQGSYPLSDIYISPLFVHHHLYTLMYVLALPVSEHSTINMPNSVYNQIAGEYGILGILLFLFLYVGYIIKSIPKPGYSIYLVLLMLAFFGFEYWFEMLSLTVVFELLLFKEIFKPSPNVE